MHTAKSWNPVAVMSLFAVNLLVSGCGSSAQHTTPTSLEERTSSEEPASPEEPTTRYREGDWVIYRFEGASDEPPVEMTERVISQRGNQLEVDVVMRRGDEERHWVQVVTDTPENQQNNVVDALYEVVDGERRQLPNVDNEDIIRLSSWIFAPIDGQTTPEGESAVELEIAGERHQCTRRTTRAVSSGRPARMIVHTCPSFLWTHGPGSLRDLETDEPIWTITVEAAGRDGVDR